MCVCVYLFLKYEITSADKINRIAEDQSVCLDIQVIAVKNCISATLKMNVENFFETSAPTSRRCALEDLNLRPVKFFASLVESVKIILRCDRCIQLPAAVANGGGTASNMFRRMFTTALTIVVCCISVSFFRE